jgi:hypothetical protein
LLWILTFATQERWGRPSLFWPLRSTTASAPNVTVELARQCHSRLKQTQEDGASLLDRTMVFLGSNLGDGSSHSVKNLPVLLAGGGFRHGQHLAFDAQNPPPLCNLYVNMLKQLGIESDKFGSSTGTLTGLEAARS